MTSKRIHKLNFLIEFNINQELIISKIKRESDKFWYKFEEEDQNIDNHPLITARVRNLKFKKGDKYKTLEHYLTDKEFSTYLLENDLAFKNSKLQKDEGPAHKKIKKDILDYRNLNFIDFMNKFHKDASNLSPSDKYLKLESLVEDPVLLSMISSDKITKKWSDFIESFEEELNNLHIKYIETNESKIFQLPAKLDAFASNYFEFCSIAYPKSTFRNNLSRFILKTPKKYRKYFLKVKVNDLSEFLSKVIPPLSSLIEADHESCVKKIGKAVSKGKETVDKTKIPYTTQEKEKVIRNSINTYNLADVSVNITDDIENAILNEL